MSQALRRAARSWGIKTGFLDANQKPVRSPDQALRALLVAITGVKTDDPLVWVREAQKRRVEAILPPTLVSEAGDHLDLQLTLPASQWNEKFRVVIEQEHGERVELDLPNQIHTREILFENKKFRRGSFSLEVNPPAGYHRLTLFQGREAIAHSLILCRPHIKRSAHARTWGLFAPLYALRSQRNLGTGDLTDMSSLQDFVFKQGGSFVGTLPLLSAVNEGPAADPSPYSPVSRLFWNEIYLDVESLSAGSRPAQEILRRFEPQLKSLRQAQTVDHARVYAMKKEILTTLAEEFFADQNQERPDFQDFLARSPEASAYAEFRAPSDQASFRYHLYCQFQMDRQLRQLAEKSKAGQTAGLYLDFPVGVSRSGFDGVRFEDSFLLQASAGAPPDLLFSGGQNWGFAPFHPIKIRENGYEYFRHCMRVNLQYASVLRLDHIMAFYRIFAIPEGFEPRDGAYLRYRAEDFFAILAIEAARAGVRIVGEDLGTVPDEVRALIQSNDALRMWVYPFEVGESPAKAATKIPEDCLACLNTHDLIPFAGYLNARDSQIFHELGFLNDQDFQNQSKERQTTIKHWQKSLKAKSPQELLTASLDLLAQSKAELVLLNAEDLWLETEPQNVPGTWKERPNWRRKFTSSLEELIEDPKIAQLLSRITQERS